jgi:hypothetical protein
MRVVVPAITVFVLFATTRVRSQMSTTSELNCPITTRRRSKIRQTTGA